MADKNDKEDNNNDDPIQRKLDEAASTGPLSPALPKASADTEASRPRTSSQTVRWTHPSSLQQVVLQTSEDRKDSHVPHLHLVDRSKHVIGDENQIPFHLFGTGDEQIATSERDRAEQAAEHISIWQISTFSWFNKIFKGPTKPKPVALKAYEGRTAMLGTVEVPAASGPSEFEPFEHGHQDLVLAVDFDFTGTRLVTASSDHCLKVFDKKEDGQYQPVDTWRAHDAEIVDVKFMGPFSTPSLASVAEDGRLKLWAEDPLATQNSGNRFKMIWSQRSETGVPFCSLATKFLHTESYIAAITRDGFLAIYEPVDFDDLSGEWGRLHSEHVCATPPPSDETGFRVDWHKETLPAWTAIEAGLDRKSLSLAVAAMNDIRILRTDKDKRFYTAVTISGYDTIVRDLAWANGSMRGYDTIAAAFKDGGVRIFEIRTPKDGMTGPSLSQTTSSTIVPTILEPESSSASFTAGSAAQARFSRGGGLGNRGASSGIATGLSRSSTPLSPNATSFDPANPASAAAAAATNASAGRIMQVSKCVADIGKEHGNVWRITWSFIGDMLLTTGDDGAVRAWKRTSTGEWLEAAAVNAVAEVG